MQSAGLILATLIVHILYFTAYRKDMAARLESQTRWFIIFLFLGPFAAAWYKSFRVPKENEVVLGSKLYLLAKNFILPWIAYVMLMPAVLYGVVVAFDSSVRMEHVAEAIFWLVLAYFIIIIPAVLLSLIIPGVVMFISRPQKDAAGQKIASTDHTSGD